MHIIQKNNIHFISTLNELILLLNNEYRFILIDENILSLYQEKFNQIHNDKIYAIKITEENKDIHSVINIIEFLLQNQVNKTDKISIVGGGAFSDVTMFAASIFKRGLNCTLIPTTLLSIVDASIGGKNAINFHSIKNIIGTIYLPQKVIIVPEFLNTLSNEQLLSGWAEILKIALVKNTTFYNKCIKHLNHSLLPDMPIIQKSIQLKLTIIQKDLTDANERQLLNYGHTIAHTIEGVYAEKQKYIPHGYAVAMGMFIENFIAEKLKLLPTNIKHKINHDIKKYYPLSSISETIIHNIPLMLQKIQQDKKNTAQHIHCTLIENIGKGKIKIPVTIDIIEQAIADACNYVIV